MAGIIHFSRDRLKKGIKRVEIKLNPHRIIPRYHAHRSILHVPKA